MTLIYLNSAHGRALVCGEIPALLNDSIEGTVEIASCESVSLSLVAVAGVVVRDPGGTPVLQLQSVSVRPDLYLLARGKVVLSTIVISEPAISLHVYEGRLGLAAAFASTAAGPPSTAPGPDVSVSALSVSGGRVEGYGVLIQNLNAEGSFDLRNGSPQITLDQASAQVRSRVSLDTPSVVADLDLEADVEVHSAELSLAVGSRSQIAVSVVERNSRLNVESLFTMGAGLPEKAYLSATGVMSPELLGRLAGAGLGSTLVSPVEIELVLDGDVDELVATAELGTAGGTVHFEGSGSNLLTDLRAELSVVTEQIELGLVVPSLAQEVARGSLRVTVAQADTGGEASRYSIDAALNDAAFGPWVVPQLEASFRLDAEKVELLSMSLPHLVGERGHFTAEGSYRFGALGQLRIDAQLPELGTEPNLARALPHLRGGLELELNARGNPTQLSEGGAQIEIDARAIRLAIAGVRIGDGRIEGTIEGDLLAPTVDLRIAARELRAADIAVAKADFMLRGNRSRYLLSGEAEGTAPALGLVRPVVVAVDVHGREAAGSLEVDGEILARGVWPSPIAVRLGGVVVDPDASVRATSVQVRGRGLSASGSGMYRFSGALNAEVNVDSLDLAVVRQRFGGDEELLAGLTGSLRGEGRWAGSFARPDFQFEVDVENAETDLLRVPSAHLDFAFLWSEGQLRGNARVDAGDDGEIAARLATDFTRSRNLRRSLRDGIWDAEIVLSDVALRAANRFLPVDTPPITGTADLRLELDDTGSEPALLLTASVQDARYGNTPPIFTELTARLADRRLHTEITVADEIRALARLETNSVLPIRALIDNPDANLILQEEWDLRLQVYPRRLERLPEGFAIQLPIQVQGLLTAEGGDRPTQANLRARGVVDPDDLPGSRGCQEQRPYRFTLEAELDNAQATAEAGARVGGQPVLRVNASAPLPIDTWLANLVSTGGIPEDLPEVAGTVQLTDLPLERVPYACQRASGTVTAEVTAEHLFTDNPEARLEAAIAQLRFGTGIPIDATLTTELGATRLGAEAHMESDGRQVFSLTSELPVSWDQSHPVPQWRDAPWRMDARFDHTPAEALLSPLPLIAQPVGTIDGSLHVSDDRGNFDARGNLSFQDVGFIWTQPALRAERMNGQVSLDRNGLVIRDFRFHDVEGEASVDGRIGFGDGYIPTELDLRLSADAFPLRTDGIIAATVSGHARVQSQLGERPLPITITTQDLAVVLPDDLLVELQPLDQHPDVIYEDQPGFERQAGETEREEEPGEEVASALIPLVVRIRNEEPFWVRREDMAVQLSADLRAEVQGRALSVDGVVELRRGYIELVGKSFELRDGLVRFDGGRSLDPFLDLEAVHSMRSGDTVTVQIGGRLSDPVLQFSTSVPNVDTEAEILALLVGGRGDSGADVGQEAAGAITSLTAGLLAGWVRREYGEFIPVLSVDAGATGTRVRAGFQADSLVPEFLRSIIVGAYVEGFFGSESEGGVQSADGGFLFELLFPHDLVYTGTFEGGSAWSADLTWEP